MVYSFILNIEDSRKKEVELRLKAEDARKKAEENFRKYKEEKEMADLSLSTDPASVLFQIKQEYHANFLLDPVGTTEKTIDKLERIKEVNHDDVLLYEFKGDMHLIRQEFDLAFIELQKGRGKNSNIHLFNALEKMKDYKSEGKLAPVEIYVKYIQHMKRYMFQQHIRMLLYDRQVRENLSEHVQLVKCTLEALNKVDEFKKFEYDNQKKFLLIEGNCRTLNDFFITYDQHVSALSTLEIDHLKLVGVTNLKTTSLQGLTLKTLDLSALTLKNANQTIKKGVTEKLIITKDQVRPELIEQFHMVTEVICK